MLGKRISREEFYKRYPKPSRDELLNDPDTRESMSAEVTKILDDRYTLYRELGASHEDATIQSRIDAGVAADALTKVGAQNQQNANIYMDNRGKYEDVNKLLEFVEAAKEPYSERANEVRRQNAMALDNLIESVRTELGVYGPYNKESIDNQSNQMDRRKGRRSSADDRADETMRRFRARNPKQEAAAPKSTDKGEGFLDGILGNLKSGVRSGVELLQKGDRAFSNKIGSGITGNDNRAEYRRLLEATPLGDIKINRADTPAEKVQAYAAATGIAAANAGVRYGLPIGGVTLAGKALIDLTAALSPADYQEQGQIRMS
jgi:hypothetical protein